MPEPPDTPPPSWEELTKQAPLPETPIAMQPGDAELPSAALPTAPSDPPSWGELTKQVPTPDIALAMQPEKIDLTSSTPIHRAGDADYWKDIGRQLRDAEVAQSPDQQVNTAKQEELDRIFGNGPKEVDSKEAAPTSSDDPDLTPGY